MNPVDNKEDELREFAYLWNGMEPGWIVRALGIDNHGVESYVVYNELSRLALIIEDDELSELVIGRMLDIQGRRRLDDP